MQHIKIYDECQEALLYIFSQPNIEKLVCNHGDVETQILDLQALKCVSRNWSKDESYLIRLALNLFGVESIKVDLNRIDKLSKENHEIALTAIRIRYHLI